MANFCFNKHQNLWSYFQSKKSLKSMTDAFLGHPVYQFLRNPEFFNFNFNGFRLPWPSRLQKYVSMCLPNSNVIILLLPCCALRQSAYVANVACVKAKICFSKSHFYTCIVYTASKCPQVTCNLLRRVTIRGNSGLV